LTAANVAANICSWDTGTPGSSGIGCVTAGTPAKKFSKPPTAGNFNLNLKAPGTGKTGSVDITATIPAWLQYDWLGAGVTNPKGRATFGVYKSPLIYHRENY
jgi:MSHA biogenesis protein MshQ